MVLMLLNVENGLKIIDTIILLHFIIYRYKKIKKIELIITILKKNQKTH